MGFWWCVLPFLHTSRSHFRRAVCFPFFLPPFLTGLLSFSSSLYLWLTELMTQSGAFSCVAFSNKILTSARNGELIMWDVNKSAGGGGGGSKIGEWGFGFEIQPRLSTSPLFLIS